MTDGEIITVDVNGFAGNFNCPMSLNHFCTY